MRQCITYYVFLVRLYYLDDDDLREALSHLEGNTNLRSLHRKFYNLFQEGFCVRAKERCTLNVHTFQHLEHARWTMGPLWATSAEPFESFYSVLRRMYQPGTRNTVKQIMENFYLKTK